MKQAITRSYLSTIPVPQRTASYSPVSNAELLDVVESTLSSYNLEVTKAKFNLANGEQQLIGYLHIGQPQDGLQMMLGIRNSYDKSRSVALAAGASVFICSNGCVSGEIVHMRKHTGNVIADLRAKCIEAVEELAPRLESVRRDRDRMQKTLVSKIDTAHILGELFHTEEVLRLQQLSIVQREIKFSEHFAMKDEESSTLWNLYNNVTEALKTTHPLRGLEAHAKAHQYFVRLADKPALIETTQYELV